VERVFDLTADRSRFVTGRANAIQVLSTAEGLPSVTAPLLHGSQVKASVFLDRGRLLVSAAGAEMRLWDVETGLPVGPPIGLPNQITAVVATSERSVAVSTLVSVSLWRFDPVTAAPAELAAQAREDGHAAMSDRGVVAYDPPPPSPPQAP